MTKYCEDCGTAIGRGRYCFTCQRERDREHRKLHPLPPVHRRILKGAKAFVAQHPVQVGLLGLAAGLMVWYNVGIALHTTSQSTPGSGLEYLNATEATPAQKPVYPDTTATQRIRMHDRPGTVEEASQMLELMSQQPGHGRYSLSFFAQGEATLFRCDLNRETLEREHYRDGGGGSKEVWKGYVLYRIKAGASGGTLNETPQGSSMAIMTRF